MKTRQKPEALVALEGLVEAAHALDAVWERTEGPMADVLATTYGESTGLPSFDAVTHALTVWRDAVATAANRDLQAVADTAIERLRGFGIGAAWEHPGYIRVSVCPVVGLSLAYAVDGDEWIGNTQGPDGDVLNRWGSWEPAPLPILTTTAEEIVDMLMAARGEYLDRVRTSLGVPKPFGPTCPTCGQKRGVS